MKIEKLEWLISNVLQYGAHSTSQTLPILICGSGVDTAEEEESGEEEVPGWRADFQKTREAARASPSLIGGLCPKRPPSLRSATNANYPLRRQGHGRGTRAAPTFRAEPRNLLQMCFLFLSIKKNEKIKKKRKNRKNQKILEKLVYICYHIFKNFFHFVYPSNPHKDVRGKI